MNKGRVLLAEDDPNLGVLLRQYLRTKGYDVQLAQNGLTAFERFGKYEFDICVFDIMMPEMDGIELTKQIRKLDKKIPILFLTAKSMKADVLKGFSVGADDYVKKPFEMDELNARIEAILRRIHGDKIPDSNHYQLGKFSYDPDSRTITISDVETKLTTKENQLLQLLAKNKNSILDRNATLKAIWGEDDYFTGRSMDVYIAKLRKHLKGDESVEIINEHGKGFKLITPN